VGKHIHSGQFSCWTGQITTSGRAVGVGWSSGDGGNVHWPLKDGSFGDGKRNWVEGPDRYCSATATTYYNEIIWRGLVLDLIL
jgi:hypothetical protein